MNIEFNNSEGVEDKYEGGSIDRTAPFKMY